jgi:hypothetical protein
MNNEGSVVGDVEVGDVEAVDVEVDDVEVDDVEVVDVGVIDVEVDDVEVVDVEVLDVALATYVVEEEATCLYSMFKQSGSVLDKSVRLMVTTE